MYRGTPYTPRTSSVPAVTAEGQAAMTEVARIRATIPQGIKDGMQRKIIAHSIPASAPANVPPRVKTDPNRLTEMEERGNRAIAEGRAKLVGGTR